MINAYDVFGVDTSEAALAAYEVLDLALAQGGWPVRDDERIDVWEVAGTTGLWRACLRGYGAAWFHGPTELDAILAQRASFPEAAVDNLAALRRNNERQFDRVARALAILRESGAVTDLGDGVERMMQRMLLRGRRRSVRVEWTLPLRGAHGRVVTSSIHASIGVGPDAPEAYVNSAYGIDNMQPASAVEWGALVSKVGGVLNDAMAALRGDDANVEGES